MVSGAAARQAVATRTTTTHRTPLAAGGTSQRTCLNFFLEHVVELRFRFLQLPHFVLATCTSWQVPQVFTVVHVVLVVVTAVTVVVIAVVEEVCLIASVVQWDPQQLEVQLVAEAAVTSSRATRAGSRRVRTGPPLPLPALAPSGPLHTSLSLPIT